MIYADSSFSASFYAPDANSRRAMEIYQSGRRRPILMTAWQELELVNTLRLLAHRARKSRAAARASIGNCRKAIAADFSRGVLRRVEPHWPSCLRRASELSERFSEEHGFVMLDIWHVALAVELGAGTFWTFDREQEKLARLCGKFEEYAGLND